MNTMIEEAEDVIKKEYILKVIDRCDSCGSQALVLIKGFNGELMFCGHHYAKHEKALEKFAYETIDERDKIIQNKLIRSSN
jgi:hypothetical protein